MKKSIRNALVAGGLGLAMVASASPLVPGTLPGLGNSPALAGSDPQLSVLASYQADASFDESGAEIVAYDDGRMYVVNGDRGVIEVVDIADPASPVYLFDIDLAAYGDDITSVAAHDGLFVAAIPASPKTDPGKVVFFDRNGNIITDVTVGALPDAVSFTANGAWVLVANEGEPNDDYTVDPEGSVSIIKTSPLTAPGKKQGATPPNAVRHVTFEDFNVGGPRHAELPSDVRIFGPGATVAQDLEPEFIATSHNNRKAFVSLQENNALAVIDIQKGKVDAILALGAKDHALAGNGLDASDRDDGINIANWPVSGLYMPDSIATFKVKGSTYVVTANEGDARDYDGFSEEARVKDLDLCDGVFPAGIQDDENLGRLTITTVKGLRAGDDCYEELYAYGARSFSIWDEAGNLVFDSGDDFEQITAAELPAYFNANNTDNDFESRSDNKGPEPEGVVTGKVGKRTFAFIGLERIGGVMVYDVTDPADAEFVQYINNRDFTLDPPAPDSGAEGLVFIDAKDSPSGEALLLVANEVSATVTVFEFK